VAVFATRAVAYAHATLVSSEPPADSRLASSPPRVRLLFNEEVDPSLAQLSLVARDGRVTRLAVKGDPHDVRALVAPVATLATGGYRLVWRVVSADGHPVEGSFVFFVGAAAGQAPSEPAVTNAPGTLGAALAGAGLAAAVLRGLGVGSLAGLTGLLFFLSWPRAAGEPPARRPARIVNWVAVAAPVFLVLHLIAWVVHASPELRLASGAESGEVGTLALLTSGVARLELWRTGLTLLASWSFWVARRQRLALAFASAALVVSGAIGHSGAIDPIVATPAKALHLLAAAAWLGGLLWLVAREPGDGALLARDAARVSTIALAAVVVVLLSGLLQAALFLPSGYDLFRSTYGAVVLVKVAGLLVLVAFGAHHRYRVVPRLDREATMSPRFATTLRGEIAVMSLVMLVGGLLAYIPTPHPAAPHTVSPHAAQ